MAWQGCRVQLEQSDMRLALNMAIMATGGFSRASEEDTQFLIKKPWAGVRDEKMWGVQFPGYKNVKSAMERHLAMLRESQTDGCLPCHDGTAQNPQTCWRRKGMGAPPLERLRQLTPGEPTPHPPKMPPVSLGKNEAAHVSVIEGVLPRYVDIHTPLPGAQFFNLDAYAKDRKRDEDFNPDLLTDAGTSTI